MLYPTRAGKTGQRARGAHFIGVSCVWARRGRSRVMLISDRSVGHVCAASHGTPRRQAPENSACDRAPTGRAPARSRHRAAPVCPASARDRTFVVIVQERGQLLAQALVALGLVAEPNGELEQLLLPFLRTLAPQIDCRFAQDLREAFRIVVFGHRALRGRTLNPKRQWGLAVPA